MSEGMSIDEIVQNVLAEWLNATGRGVLNSFVLSAEIINEDGQPFNLVTQPDTQGVSASLGLSVYAKNVFHELQRRDLLELIYTDFDEDDE